MLGIPIFFFFLVIPSQVLLLAPDFPPASLCVDIYWGTCPRLFPPSLYSEKTIYIHGFHCPLYPGDSRSKCPGVLHSQFIISVHHCGQSRRPRECTTGTQCLAGGGMSLVPPVLLHPLIHVSNAQWKRTNSSIVDIISQV